MEFFKHLRADTTKEWKLGAAAPRQGSALQLAEATAITIDLIQIGSHCQQNHRAKHCFCDLGTQVWGVGCSYQSIAAPTSRGSFTEDEIHLKQHKLKLKLRWLMREHGVPPARVVDIDEIAFFCMQHHQGHGH
eukprot:897733-Amphidinium_carterae.1